MKKWEKYTGFLLLFVTILLIIILLTISLLRNFLLRQAIHYANRNLLVRIDFDRSEIQAFSSYPLVHVYFHELTVTGKGIFSEDTLLYVPDTKITLDISRAFRKNGQILIKEVDGSYPSLRLLVDLSGLANYYFIPTKEEITTSASQFYIIIESLNIFRGQVSYNDLESNIFIGSENVAAKFQNLKISSQSAEFYLSAFFEDSYVKHRNIYLFRHIDLGVESDYKNTFPDCVDNYYFNGQFSLNKLKFSAKGLFENTGLCDTNHFHNYNLKIAALTKDFKDLLSVVNVLYSRNFSRIKARGTYQINLEYMSKKTQSIDTSNLQARVQILNGYANIPWLNETLEDVNLLAYLTRTDHLKIKINYAQFRLQNNYFTLNKLLVNNKLQKTFITGSLDTRLDLKQISIFFPFNKLKISGLLNAHININGFINRKKPGELSSLNIKGLTLVNQFSFTSPNTSFSAQHIGSYITKHSIFITSNNANLNGQSFSYSLSAKNYIPYLLSKTSDVTTPLIVKTKIKTTSLDLNKILFSITSSSPKVYLPIPMGKNITATIDLQIDTVKYKSLKINNLRTQFNIFPDSIIINTLLARVSETQINLTAQIKPINDQIFITFGSDITQLHPSYLPRWLNLSDSVKDFLSHTRGNVNIGISGSFIYFPRANKKVQNIYLTGKLLTPWLQLPNNNITARLSQALKIPQLSTPLIQDMDLYFRYQFHSLTIPRSSFNLSSRPATLEGYYSPPSNLINFTLGLTVSKKEILRLLHKTITGEDHTFIYLTIIGKATDPKIRISTNLLRKSTTANLQNQSLHTKALADSLRAARVVERQQKKQSLAQAKQNIKQTRQRTKLIMRKARKISRQLLKQNTPEARKKARQVIRNARKMRKQLLKLASKNRKLQKKKARVKIDTLSTKYRELKRRLRKIIIN